MKYASIYLVVFVLLGQSALAQDSQPGSTYASILPKITMGVEFRSAAIAFVAHRSNSNADFAVQVTFADDRPTQQCLATSDLAGKLEGMSSFFKKRELSLKQAKRKFPVLVGRLTLLTDRESVDGYSIYADSKRQRIVAFDDDNKAVELVGQAADYAIFAEGCKVFGKK